MITFSIIWGMVHGLGLSPLWIGIAMLVDICIVGICATGYAQKKE